MALISIIIPCYNYGKFLPDTLKSVIKQTNQNWECIIVNDGSTDNTEEVAKEFLSRDKRFIYVYQANKGLSAARNTGVKESKGEYIQFIDADDLIESRKLEEQALFFVENPSCDIVYSSVRYFRTQFPAERLFSMSRINKSWMPNVTGRGNTIIKYLIHRNIMAANCPLIRRRVFEKAGYFNVSLKYLEDWDFWLRCALNNLNFFYLDKPDTLALVRIHGKSLTNNTWDMRCMELQIKQSLKNKVEATELKNLLDEQIFLVKRTLAGIAFFELLNGNVTSFKDKLKLIAEEDTLSAATLKIIKNRYFPIVSMGKVLFYGKKLFSNSK